jgi:succinoglycan biosynthesis transport protein ExoP
MTLSPNVSQPQPAARRQVDFLKRQAPLIVFVTWAALAAAAAVSFTQANVYRASTKIVVVPGAGGLDPRLGPVIQPFTQTLSPLAKSDVVANRVIQDLGLNETTESLLKDLHVSSTPESAVLEVTYDAHNPAQAVRILNRIAAVFTSRVRAKLGQSTDPTAPKVTAKVWEPAHASPNPVSPHPAQALAFAGIIGLALGIVLGLLRDALDERIHRRDELEEYFGAPVVAALPKGVLARPVVDRRRGVDYSDLHAIDPLRVQLSRAKPHERLITITSGGTGEGKSTVAASLGVALALSGADVICVDVVPNRHSLSHRLGFPSSGAEASVLPRPDDLQDALRDVTLEEMAVKGGVDVRHGLDPGEAAHDLGSIVAGNGKHGRLQLLVLGDRVLSDQESLTSWSIGDLVTNLKVHSNYVIVDAPSLPSGTTFALLSVSDWAIIVAREGRTTKEQARFVRNALETLQMPRWGIVSIGQAGPSVAAFAQSRTRPPQAPSRTRERKAR